MKTLKELADIGAAAAFASDTNHKYLSVSGRSHSWIADEPAHQAFAQAVRDAVLAEVFPKSDSSPTSKTIPLDYTDIRATDEFRHVGTDGVRLAYYWNSDTVSLGGLSSISYAELAANYLRRQHGSNEWKPCTKEVTV